MKKSLLYTIGLIFIAASCTSTAQIQTETQPTLSLIIRPSSTPTLDPELQFAQYQVKLGDTLLSIAGEFGLEPQSILWSNWEIFSTDPDSIKPGLTLIMPPVDGAIHRWKPFDTIDSLAESYGVTPEAITQWPGNAAYFMYSEPSIESGDRLFIPGGSIKIPFSGTVEITTAEP